MFGSQSQRLKEARSLQTQEGQTQEELTKAELSIKHKEERLADMKKQLNMLVEKHGELQKQTESIKSYLQKNVLDEKLLSTLGVIEQNLKQYYEAEKELSGNRREAEKLTVSLRDEQTVFDLAKKKVEKFSLIHQEKGLVYKKLEESTSIDVKLEDGLQKRLRDTQTLLIGLESYKKLLKRRDKESLEKDTNSVEEKSLLEKIGALTQHIDEIKSHIVTLRDKKEREQRLQKYEDDRSRLIKGEACSLCGSTEHPYVEDLAEVHLDETEVMITDRQTELEKKVGALKALESRLIVAQTKMETSALEMKKLDGEIETVRTTFKAFSFALTDDSEADLKERVEEGTTQLSEFKQKREQKEEALIQRDEALRQLQAEERSLHALMISLQKCNSDKEQFTSSVRSNKAKIETVLESLKTHFKAFSLESEVQTLDTQYQELVRRKSIYTENLEALRVVEKELGLCSVDKKESETRSFSMMKAIESDRQTVKELALSLKGLASKRIEILDVADLDTYEEEMMRKYKALQESERLSKNQLGAITTKHEERTRQKKALDFKVIEDEKRSKLLDSELATLFEENGFKDEDDLQSATLSTQKREGLEVLCKSVEEKFTQANTLKIETAKKLIEHQKEPRSDRSVEELELMQALSQQKVEALQESVGSDKKELELNEKNIANHQERIAFLEKKKETFKVWVKLNELIGSADGTKFKKFAQGITLDQLIDLANRHLQLLSARYTLVRSQDKLLEMEVVDAFQGNVIRPVSTLSGGESFIVSLALALGLSELASQKIAIDSLFLDEGFGTLDEDSLETALNALNLFQSAGKMVGVISHVEALKERIPLQIKVIPNGDGTSFVEVG